MFEPTNEQGVVVAFSSRLHESDWRIESIGTAFPDAILSRKGEEWR